MSLPFLKSKAQTGVIISQRKPDGGNELEGQEGEENQGLGAAAADLIRAVHAKDESAVASALRAAFEILDSEPHAEGEHTNEENEQGQE